MTLTASQFLKNPELSNVYAVFGEERFFFSAVKKRIKASLDLEPVSMNTAVLSGKFTSAEFSNAVDQLPVMAQCRLVVCGDSILTSNPDVFFETIRSMPETTTLIIELSKADKRTTAFKKLAGLATVIECCSPGEDELTRWVIQTAAKAGLTFTTANAAELIAICGKDMNNLISEISKLAALGNFSRREFLDIVTATTEYKAYLIHDLLIDGKVKQAAELIDAVTRQEKSAVPIIGAVASKLRQCAVAKSLEKYPDAPRRLASAENMHPYAAQIVSKQAKRMRQDALCSAIIALAEYDFNVKSGIAVLPPTAFLVSIYSVL